MVGRLGLPWVPRLGVALTPGLSDESLVVCEGDDGTTVGDYKTDTASDATDARRRRLAEGDVAAFLFSFLYSAPA